MSALHEVRADVLIDDLFEELDLIQDHLLGQDVLRDRLDVLLRDWLARRVLAHQVAHLVQICVHPSHVLQASLDDLVLALADGFILRLFPLRQPLTR